MAFIIENANYIWFHINYGFIYLFAVGCISIYGVYYIRKTVLDVMYSKSINMVKPKKKWYF